jgi:tRNA(Ile)-lysidine synthase
MKTAYEDIYTHVNNTLSMLLHNKDSLVIIIGISGGIDSTVLLHILHDLKKTIYKKKLIIHAAHIQHGWSTLKKEWEKEEQEELNFCKTICHEKNIPLHTHIITNIDQHKTDGSYESQARNIRRLFFKHVQEKLQADYICLGHHADDQIETFFIRLLRGSSLSGLGCMQNISEESYWRPLLMVSKKTIITAGQEKNISYCIDTGNTSEKFLRNRIRNILIPTIKNIDERYKITILSTINNLQAACKVINCFTENEYKRIYNKENKQLIIKDFLLLDIYIQYEILQIILIEINIKKELFSTSLYNEIIRFMKNTKSSQHNIENIHIKKNNMYIIFTLVEKKI